MSPLRERASNWNSLNEQSLGEPINRLILETPTMLAWHAEFGGSANALPCPEIPKIHHEQLAMLADRLDAIGPASKQQILATVDRILWGCMGLSIDEIFEINAT